LIISKEHSKIIRMALKHREKADYLLMLLKHIWKKKIFYNFFDVKKKT